MLHSRAGRQAAVVEHVAVVLLGIAPALYRDVSAALAIAVDLAVFARPVIPPQSQHDVLGNRVDGFALLPGKRFDEVFRKKGNIVEPFAQRRQRDGKDVQSVKEIGPELPFLDQTSQVLVSRGDDPHINLDRATTAQPLDCLS